MSYTLSECENFIKVGEMEFMALDQTESTCHECYFMNHDGECMFQTEGEYYNLIRRNYCTPFNRKDKRNIIWLRIE